jgi:bifunctional DNA-binding transcriptional regulator/antitoxin component of YhaV-PrlF toxin-antitoxin module
MTEDKTEGFEATTPVQLLGRSSLGVIIPYPVARDLKINKGDFMKVRRAGSVIIYEKI